MAQLVFSFPARDRAADLAAGSGAAVSVSYVLGEPGATAQRQGRCAPALLPRAATTVAVVPAERISWHQVVLPKAPAARLREALAGVLEEALLDDTANIHLALQPQARTGVQTWICAVDRAWLKAQIEQVERHGLRIDRVVPEAMPVEVPVGIVTGPQEAEFVDTQPGSTPQTQHGLLWCDPRGVLSLPLDSGLARELARREAHWFTEPSAAAAAESLLRRPVPVMDRATRLLAAAQTAWNLRQFELAPRSRGMRALRDLGRTLREPAWRPVRWGVAALLLTQLVGLNAWAWQRQGLVRERQAQVNQLLRDTFPHVPLVLDAPVQMARELDLVRARAGQPGAADLEPMLQALAADWPAALPISALEYEPGRLTLVAEGIEDGLVDSLQRRIQGSEWRLDRQGNRLTLATAASR